MLMLCSRRFVEVVDPFLVARGEGAVPVPWMMRQVSCVQDSCERGDSCRCRLQDPCCCRLLSLLRAWSSVFPTSRFWGWPSLAKAASAAAVIAIVFACLGLTSARLLQSEESTVQMVCPATLEGAFGCWRCCPHTTDSLGRPQ